ncbi:hypothetical protein QTO34_013360 [Cnephaeus nilssonii]|uniref:Uncharacterized protein n=1 Tax=Cnephaeus nilssonii TaxID=3371016 RepID=A0AA40I7W6_CNENI|nr:hypothetical protein QTO34_013360 [Eptesicus nilssonii]
MAGQAVASSSKAPSQSGLLRSHLAPAAVGGTPEARNHRLRSLYTGSKEVLRWHSDMDVGIESAILGPGGQQGEDVGLFPPRAHKESASPSLEVKGEG